MPGMQIHETNVVNRSDAINAIREWLKRIKLAVASFIKGNG
jgi:hypothetical protein